MPKALPRRRDPVRYGVLSTSPGRRRDPANPVAERRGGKDAIRHANRIIVVGLLVPFSRSNIARTDGVSDYKQRPPSRRSLLA